LIGGFIGGGGEEETTGFMAGGLEGAMEARSGFGKGISMTTCFSDGFISKLDGAFRSTTMRATGGLRLNCDILSPFTGP
jgi:hypothetical protein